MKMPLFTIKIYEALYQMCYIKLETLISYLKCLQAKFLSTTFDYWTQQTMKRDSLQTPNTYFDQQNIDQSDKC